MSNTNILPQDMQAALLGGTGMFSTVSTEDGDVSINITANPGGDEFGEGNTDDVTLDELDTSETPEAVAAETEEAADVVAEDVGNAEEASEMAAGLESMYFMLQQASNEGYTIDGGMGLAINSQLAHLLRNRPREINGIPVNGKSFGVASVEDFQIDGAQASTVSLEAIGEMAKNAAKNVAEFAKKIWASIVNFIRSILNSTATARERLSVVMNKARSAKSTGGKVNFPAVLGGKLDVKDLEAYTGLTTVVVQAKYTAISALIKDGKADEKQVLAAARGIYTGWERYTNKDLVGNIRLEQSGDSEIVAKAGNLKGAEGDAPSVMTCQAAISECKKMLDQARAYDQSKSARERYKNVLTEDYRTAMSKDDPNLMKRIQIRRKATTAWAKSVNFETTVMGKIPAITNAVANVVTAALKGGESRGKAEADAKKTLAGG